MLACWLGKAPLSQLWGNAKYRPKHLTRQQILKFAQFLAFAMLILAPNVGADPTWSNVMSRNETICQEMKPYVFFKAQ